MAETLPPYDYTQQESRIPSVEDLFSIGNPAVLQEKIKIFFETNKDSAEHLEQLVKTLISFEDKLNAALINNPAQQRHSFPDPEKIKTTYDESRKLKKSKIPFSTYLFEYIRQRKSIPTLAQKYAEYRTLNEAVAAQKRERELAHEALISEKLLSKKIEELKLKLKKDLLYSAKEKLHVHEHTNVDRARITQIENATKKELERGGIEAKEHFRHVSEQETLLGVILESEHLFGEDKRIYHTDKFDDYFTHADLAVEIEEGLLILIDITYDQRKEGKKLYYNRQNPVRFLVYPSHTDLAHKPGIPIVLGMPQREAEETIDIFLDTVAREKLGIAPQNISTPNTLEEGVGRWVEYILTQLTFQREYIEIHLYESVTGHTADNYRKALALYDRAIAHFTKIKKGRSVDIASSRRPWDEELSNPEKAIGRHLRASGQEDREFEAPDLFEFDSSF